MRCTSHGLSDCRPYHRVQWDAFCETNNADSDEREVAFSATTTTTKKQGWAQARIENLERRQNGRGRRQNGRGMNCVSAHFPDWMTFIQNHCSAVSHPCWCFCSWLLWMNFSSSYFHVIESQIRKKSKPNVQSPYVHPCEHSFWRNDHLRFLSYKVCK